MNWDAIGAISGIIAMLITLFIEWPRLKERWLEVKSLFTPAFSISERLEELSGYIIGIGVLLILAQAFWHHYYFSIIGRLLFTFGCFSLGYFVILRNRQLPQSIINGNKKELSPYERFTLRLTTFVSIYLIVFGISAGISAIWSMFHTDR
jgi:hypothetical protein